MCRLFAMAGGDAALARHCLTGASNSIAKQSVKNPHGAGLAGFVGGAPVLERSVLPAHANPAFAGAAMLGETPTLLGHVRDATVGALEVRNNHPFVDGGRAFAHNGSIRDTKLLEATMAPERLVKLEGNTDSERWFHVVQTFIDRAGGDVDQGIRDASDWVARSTPITSANFGLTTADELRAVRIGPQRTLNWARHEGDRPAVIVASEPLDELHDWQALAPNTMLKVDARTLETEISQVTPREVWLEQG